MPGPGHLHVQYPLVRRKRRFIPERRVPRQQLECKNTQGPPVHLDPVSCALDHLRGQVVRRPPQGEGHVDDDLGEPKITHFDVPVVINEHILRLQVSVADLHGVEVLESQDHLGAVELGVVVCQSPLHLQVPHEFAAHHVLQQEKKPVFILEGGKQIDQKGVLNYLQDGLFRSQVLNLLQPEHLILLEDLQSEGMPVGRSLHLHDPHPRKCSRPHRGQQIKVADREGSPRYELLELGDRNHVLERMMNVGFGRHGCQPPAESRHHLGIA
mmetsp:Transcript_1143/g.2256  ORF Transcript_1143/g.2256 Transcript_1143/m.2256 type:complete len:269 (+) Transcript_1143:297-1103(+)